MSQQEIINTFLRVGTYYGTAQELGSYATTIKKRLAKVKDPFVQAVIKARTYRKYTKCIICYRNVKLIAKGECGACYQYFRTIGKEKRTRRIFKN